MKKNRSIQMKKRKESIKKLDNSRLISNIDELAKSSQTTYLTYFAVSTYILIALFGITDLDMIKDSFQVELPVVNKNIPMVLFFITAPFLCIGFFVYMNIYFIELNRLIKLLFVRKPEYDPNDLYPWIFIFSEYPSADRSHKSIIKITKFITALLQWWMLPFTLLFISTKYAKVHDRVLSYILIILLISSVVISLCFWLYSEFEKIKKIYKKKASMGLFIIDKVIFVLVFIFLIFNYFIFFEKGMIGERQYYLESLIIFKSSPYSLKSSNSLYRIFERFNLSNTLNLSYQNISKEKEDKNIRCWGSLKGKNLNGADFTGSNLINMDLSYCSFQKASFRNSNLENTDLFNAQMQGAKLFNAQMQGVNLADAQLQGAVLTNAQMQGANLWQVRLEGADLCYAQMQGVNLSYAQLLGVNMLNTQMQGACLFNADLQGSNLLNINLQGAILTNAHLRGADMTNAQLQGSDLTNAQLQGVELTNARLQGANLENAEISKTDFINSSDVQNTIKYLKKNNLNDITFRIRTYERSNKNTDLTGSDLTNIILSKEKQTKEIDQFYQLKNNNTIKNFKLYNENKNGKWEIYRIKFLYELSKSDINLKVLFDMGLPNYFKSGLNENEIELLKKEGIKFKEYLEIGVLL